MKLLHLIRTINDDTAARVIAAQKDEHEVAVILLHDAVLSPPQWGVTMYASAADVQARGITTDLPLVDYEKIVQMTFEYDKVTVW